MHLQRLVLLCTCLSAAVLQLACTNCEPFDEGAKELVANEIRAMFDEYHASIATGGLTAEFEFLDQSDEFFWVPPGYTSALTFDSVKTILETSAPTFTAIHFTWDTLQITPLSRNIGSYSGIVKGTMIDTLGITTSVAIIESGTVIKRKDGWKLLNGQSAALETSAKLNETN